MIEKCKQNTFYVNNMQKPEEIVQNSDKWRFISNEGRTFLLRFYDDRSRQEPGETLGKFFTITFDDQRRPLFQLGDHRSAQTNGIFELED